MFAARYGHTDIARLLLSLEGIDVNMKEIRIYKSFIIFKSKQFLNIIEICNLFRNFFIEYLIGHL